MLVSWNWLSQYVALDMSVEQLETRLMMAGLNHEGTQRVGNDVVIDLEVTSNRPDCLGHIGVAREVAVLWDRSLKYPQREPECATTPREVKPRVSDLSGVTIDCPELCSRYTARVVRGAKVGPSPPWLTDRLRAIGLVTINNVVDVSNYVMMEYGQPLHVFDFSKLTDQTIVVRQARQEETFVAIDHKSYQLDREMCVIADAERSVALGGVMGGFETEVSTATTDLLIEAAQFDPVSIRNTARKLNLHSPSSYRFERGVDPEGIDWASRRCCELILDLAGGELVSGVIDVGTPPNKRSPIVLRLGQLKRILGIDVEPAKVRKILAALGNEEIRADTTTIEVVPPSWRRDLTREIDLVEEVARIHGYDQIAEDVGVPMVASSRSDKDRVIERVRHVLTASGFHEAMTISAVDDSWAAVSSPWTDRPPLRCSTPVLRRSNQLRQSLVPSLLGARRTNENLANQVIELFELAHIYLRQEQGVPKEESMLALTSGGDFSMVKGVVEAILDTVARGAQIEVETCNHPLLDRDRSCNLRLNGDLLGYLGEVGADGLNRFQLRSGTTVSELKLSTLLKAAQLVGRQTQLSPYPAVMRDRNVVFDEKVRWSDVARVVRQHGGDYLERIEYQETYRDQLRLGKGKKSLLFGITLRSHDGTLTREEADAVCARIDGHLRDQLGGRLRA